MLDIVAQKFFVHRSKKLDKHEYLFSRQPDIRISSQNMSAERLYLQQEFFCGAFSMSIENVEQPSFPSSSSNQAGVQALVWQRSMRFDLEADIVVVGFGGAGASAAIAARRLDCSVIVLEKLAVGGGNTAVSAGNFIIPSDAQKAFEYLSKTFEMGCSEMDEPAVRRFCQEAAATKDFFAGLDPSIELEVAGHANFPHLPHAEVITKYHVKGPKTGGINLFTTLRKWVEKLGAQVLYETPAMELVAKDGAVVGVLARHQQKDILIKARKGVILCTGGYECDAQALAEYCQASRVLSLGTPANTGDGLRLAQTVNAGLWHMRSYSCPLGMQVPGLNSALPFLPMTPGYVWINQFGKRFANEADVDFHSCLYSVNSFDPVAHCYPAIPCWAVFDETARLSGSLTHQRFGYGAVIEGYAWSADCSREIEAGVVKKADTLEELARIIGVDGSSLCASIERWNAFVERGCDEDFGRRMHKPLSEKDSLAGLTPRRLSAPISKPPFYAVELYPALLNTQGGPRRNEFSQVLDRAGRPINRLYAAGELGSLWGTVYQGSSNVAECLACGRIAARHAAALCAWDENKSSHSTDLPKATEVR